MFHSDVKLKVKEEKRVKIRVVTVLSLVLVALLFVISHVFLATVRPGSHFVCKEKKKTAET